MLATNETILYDFQKAIPQWDHTDDVVMGGLSESRFEFQDEVLLFTGNVSLENNGGFASAYLQEQEFDLSNFTGITLRVRGDGKHYGFNLMTPGGERDQIHRAYFDAPTTEWTTVHLPFGEFVPMRKGNILSKSIRPDLTQVRRMGFIISEKQAGKFALQVAAIAAYQA